MQYLKYRWDDDRGDEHVASYAALVEPQGRAWPYPMMVATYRLAGTTETLRSGWWQRAFAPLAAADRKLRPE